MTMPFEVRNTNELRGLQPGDAISFQLIVTDSDGWIDHITKSSSSRPAELSSRPTFRLVRDVDPLQAGDLLPEYHFTNELGQPIDLRQFRGQTLVTTGRWYRRPTCGSLMRKPGRAFRVCGRKRRACTPT